MKLGAVNTGGLLSSFAYILELIDDFSLDVLVVSETRLHDRRVLGQLCRQHGLGHVGLLRPADDDSYRSCAGGGLAVLARKGVILQPLSRCAKGALAIRVQAPRVEPFAVIAAYVPPLSAARKWRPELFGWICDEYKRLTNLYRRVVIAGDLNSRLGTPPGLERYTEDVRGHLSGPASVDIMRLCTELNVLPTHGRCPEWPGRLTCQNPATQAFASECDYILLPSSAFLGVDFSMDYEQCTTTVDSAHTHRLITTSLLLCTSEAVSVPTKRPSPRPVHIPSYNNDAVWNSVSEDIAQHFASVSLAQDLRTMSAEDELQLVTKALLEVQQKHLSRPAVSMRSGAYRRLRGKAVSPRIAMALYHVRQAFKIIQRPDIAQYAESSGQLQELRRRLRDVQRSVRVQARAEQNKLIPGQARAMNELLAHDAHGHFVGDGQRVQSPDDPLLLIGRQTIPSGDDGVPAVQRFSDAAASLAAETRPTPPGPSSPAWTQYIPRAASAGRSPAEGGADIVGPGLGQALDSPITELEVYYIVFPPSKQRAPPSCHPDCSLCKAYLAHYTDWRDDRTDIPPTYKPTLHTSKAAGPEGITAEVLRWARPLDRKKRREYRTLVSAVIAKLLNRFLDEGGAPAAFTPSTITPVLKSAKPGQPVDRSDPDSHRNISVSGVLSKILSLVLTRRLTHWAVLNNVINESQIGFLPHYACEEHVFTLTQTVKARLRAGQSTYALFVDFTKAYDHVHLGALWEVLRIMGVPPRLIQLLRGLSLSRSARMRVNGEMSAPFRVDKGVPQGDPLSCLLYILYVESLSRLLSSDPVLRASAATVRDVAVLLLLYADDLAVLMDSEQALQHALSLVTEWAAAWGATVSTGRAKTEAMAFVPGQTKEQAESRAPLRCGSSDIAWTACYRYLGYMLRHDLNEDGMLAKTVAVLRKGFERYFTYTSLNRALPLASQLQLYRTTSACAADYLRCILRHPAKALQSNDKRILVHVRKIIGLPRNCSNDLVWFVCQMLPTVGVVARDVRRLQLQLASHVHRNALSRVLYSALSAERRSRSSTTGTLSNWAHTTSDAQRKAVRLGAVIGKPAGSYDISRAAHETGRSLAFTLLQRKLQLPAASPLVPGRISLPPDCHGSRQHLLSLCFGLPWAPQQLGDLHGRTALSMHGPGCSGSLLAIARDGRYPAYVPFLLGTEALSAWPFCANKVDASVPVRHPGVDEECDDGEDAGDNANGVRVQGSPSVVDDYSVRFSRRACPLCNASVLSTFHLACECQHALLQEVRGRMAESLSPLYDNIVRLCKSAVVDDAGEEPSEEEQELIDSIPDRIPVVLSPDVASAEDRFLLYWTLTAWPWPAAVACDAQPTARALGEVFDKVAVKHRWLRRLARTWLRWSEGAIIDLAAAWNAAINNT